MPTILVVEDSFPNAQLIKAAMETRGYDVVCATTGVDGLRLAEELHPDVILIDLRLPGVEMDGWDVIRALRAHHDLSHIPIIVTSVEIMPDDRQRAYEAGCDVYYAKPFKIGELRDLIISYVNGK